MFLYGASGHAKVIIDILKKNNKFVKGLFDDNPKITELNGIKCYGSFKIDLLKDNDLIISIGNNNIRHKIAKQLPLSISFGKAIDLNAIISSSVIIGIGTVVMPGAIVNADSVIGEHVIINTSASIDHECKIGDFVHISPNTTLCGNVHIGKNSHIGAGATIIPNITIGKNVIIGAGSVVTKDIPDNYTAVGIPARKIKKNE